MAGENSTIARPYAEAVFARAEETGKLDPWSEILQFLAETAKDPALAAIIADPMFGRDKLTELMIDIGGERLDDEGRNLVRVLVQNDRLSVLPEIVETYERLKAESQRIVNVHVRSAFELQPTQINHIAEMLKVKLGRDITITTEEDPDLIGGIHIRAGDTVIDGSVRGHLQQLANELGI